MRQRRLIFSTTQKLKLDARAPPGKTDPVAFNCRIKLSGCAPAGTHEK